MTDWAAIDREQKAQNTDWAQLNRDQQAAKATGGTNGTLTDVVRQFAQGMSFDFADEIEAGVRAPFSDKNYGEIVNDIRGQNAEYFNENPLKAIATQGAAGFVPLLGWGSKLFKGGKLAKKALEMIPKGHVGRGVAEGAVSGLGQTDSLDEGALADIGIGAGLGGGVGSITGLATKFIKPLSKRPKTQTGRFVNNVMGGSSPKEMADATRAVGRGGALADATPEMRGAAQYVGSRPGSRDEMNNFLDERQFAQPEILQGIVTDATGETGDVFARRAILKNARSKEAKNLYENGIHKEFIEPTPEMIEFLDNPVGKKIAKKVMSAMSVNGTPGIDESNIQNSAKFWDMFTREMRDNATNSNFQMKKNSLAPELMSKKRAIDADVDTMLDGRLQGTRDRYAQLSKDLDAVDTGQQFMKMNSDDFIREIEGMSDAEKKSVLAGMTNSMMNKIDQAPETANNAWNAVKSGAYKKKIRALIGDEKADEYINKMMGQREQTITRNATSPDTNSATGHLKAFDESFGGDIADVAADAAQGQIIPMAKKALGLFSGSGPSKKDLQQLSTLLRLPADEVEAALKAVTREGRIAPTLMPGLRRGANAALVVPQDDQ